MLLLERRKWRVDAEVPALHHDDPIARTHLRRLSPGNLSSVIHYGDPMVVGRLQREPKLRLDRVDVCESIILRDQSRRVARAVEDLLAREIFPKRWRVQQMTERLETRGRPHQTGGRDAPALLHGLRGGIENPHERDGTGGDAHRALQKPPLRPRAEKPKSCPPPWLGALRLPLQRVEDAIQAVLDRQ